MVYLQTDLSMKLLPFRFIRLPVLLPSNVQELNDSGNNYYGINQISKNINVGNRKRLINGNRFVFGVLED